MRTRIAIFALVVALATALPVAAYAAEAKSSKESTQTYDLNFSLPTAGKSGCQVCHGDPNLVKVSAEATASIYVDSEVLAESAHVDQFCTNCHVDFAYETPHDAAANGEEWQEIAKQSCGSCKDHQPQSAEVISGAHSPAGQPGQTPEQAAAQRAAEGKPAELPTCGGCHGSHAIPSKEDTEAYTAYQATAMTVCGGCHVEEAESYNDYYHGAAYKEGAFDAPACWDCHGAHEVRPADDRQSMVSEQRLAETCGTEGCHSDVQEQDEEFLAYAELIHGRQEAMEEVPIYTFIDNVKSAFDSMTSWFRE